MENVLYNSNNINYLLYFHSELNSGEIMNMFMSVNNIFRKTLLLKYIQDYDYYSLQRAFIVNSK